MSTILPSHLAASFPDLISHNTPHTTPDRVTSSHLTRHSSFSVISCHVISLCPILLYSILHRPQLSQTTIDHHNHPQSHTITINHTQPHSITPNHTACTSHRPHVHTTPRLPFPSIYAPAAISYALQPQLDLSQLSQAPGGAWNARPPSSLPSPPPTLYLYFHLHTQLVPVGNSTCVHGIV